MGRSFPGLGLGGDPPPSHFDKQLLEGSPWVAGSTDKPEGFLLDRNAHGPHLLQLLEHLVSGPVKGAAVPGSGFFCVSLQQPVYCDYAICVLCVLFDLAAGKGKGSRFTPVCTGWFLQPHPDIKARGLQRGCLYLEAFGLQKQGVGSISFLWASQVWLAFHLFLYY